MNKREAVLSVLIVVGRSAVPAAFFTHFDPACHFGQAAVAQHLEFFRATGMDFVKIQMSAVSALAEICRPADWARVPRYGKEFRPVLEAGWPGAGGRGEALVVMTLSPFMCAGHTAGPERLVAHLQEEPEAVRPGLEAITDSLMVFVQECIRLGVDGFYHPPRAARPAALPTRPSSRRREADDLILMRKPTAAAGSTSFTCAITTWATRT